VLGDVRTPGYYDYKEGVKLLELISQAGGFLESAKISKVRIVHASAPDQKQEAIQVDLNQILSGKKLISRSTAGTPSSSGTEPGFRGLVRQHDPAVAQSHLHSRRDRQGGIASGRAVRREAAAGAHPGYPWHNMN